MNFLRRSGTILAGYFAAAMAAFMVPAGFFFFGFPDSISPSDLPDAIRGVALIMLLVGGSLLVPTLLVIAICEALRIRNMFAYLTLGAVIAVALTIFMIGWSNAGEFKLIVSGVTGVVAGFIYWWIAGRHAGGMAGRSMNRIGRRSSSSATSPSRSHAIAGTRQTTLVLRGSKTWKSKVQRFCTHWLA